MKKFWVLGIASLLLLAGCSPSRELETVSDTMVQPQRGEMQQMVINLPETAAAAVMSAEETGTVYFCDDFVLTMQTVESGDLQRTLMDTTGYMPNQLPVMETVQGNAKRYDCIWTAAGEAGDQVGRCAVLDDGNYHYILTVMADANKSAELTQSVWNSLFSTYRIAPEEEGLNSGS